MNSSRRFNQHPDLEGKHAFLSASKYHWIRYDEEKLLDRFDKHMDAALGTRLHAFAAEAIKLGQNMPNNGLTLNMYVNDCIGYRMTPEVLLFATRHAFGTADALSFGPDPIEPKNPPILRCFDLKNGTSTKSDTYEDQLNIYAAYFCMEYNVKPGRIQYDLRIYQNDEIVPFETDPADIAYIIDWTKTASELLDQQMEVM